MTLPKEKKQARFMMHVNVIIGALCIILFVISIALKMWIVAPCMAICGILQYFSYKNWQKRDPSGTKCYPHCWYLTVRSVF